MFPKSYLNLRLSNKFILPTIAVIFLSFLCVGIYFIEDQRKSQEIRLEEKAERITKLLLSSSIESIWDVDLKNLEWNCQAFFEDEEITRLVIVDTFNKEEVLVNLLKDVRGSRDIVKKADFIRGDHKIAKLEVVFSNYYIERDLVQLRNTFMILSILMFLLMIGIIKVVSQIALRPLKGMMEGVHHLTEGDLNFRIPVLCQDELGKLTVSFNAMAEELNLYHGHLHELVDTRTAELKNTNVQLQQEIVEREKYEKALRGSEEKYRELVQNANSIILRWDTEGKVTFFNEYAQNFFGYQEEEIIGRHVVGTIVPETESTGRNLGPLMDDICKNPQKFEYNVNENIRKDGSKVWVAWTNKILTDNAGNPVGALSIGADITQRKLAEEELQRAMEDAEKANTAKSVFLANMSHELRTPLNAILGFAQLMNKSSRDASDEESLRIIQRSGNHLLDLINQVLDLSKIEAGRSTIESNCFDLTCLLDELENMLSLKAREKNLALVFDSSPELPRYICTDVVKLRQVLINLLGNAVKFTDEGSVTLRIAAEESCCKPSPSSGNRGDCILRFEIEDTGIGIAPRDIDYLFEAFGQIPTGREVSEGTGLGLAISNKFVRLLGGEIHLSSEAGKGATFRFEIPVELVDKEDLPSGREANRVIALEPGQSCYRMVIVDDKWDNRQLLVKLLEPFDFELREAVNGNEAVELVEKWRPHLIWMDIRMPVMNGDEAAREIRAMQPPVRQPVIIAVTASVFEEKMDEVLAAGCDDIVLKPYKESEIIGMLKKHLNINFLYEKNEITTKKTKLASSNLKISPADFHSLPKEIVFNLKESVERLEADSALSVIEEIRRRNEHLADILQKLVEEYRFEKIEELLGQNEKH